MPGFLGVITLTLALGFLADLLVGDPRHFPHPVRFFGAITLFLEQVLRPRLRSAAGEIIGGLLLVILVAGGVLVATLLLMKIAFAAGCFWGILVGTYLMYSAVAVKDMLIHVEGVALALAQDDLAAARRQVALLVSRETAELDQAEITRAALESLLENQADGVTAPLFFGALGGAPLAMFYKAVNTLDSMVGYKTSRYRHWGWAAARLDDVLNFFPARLSALCLLLAGFTMGCPWRQSLGVFYRDRLNHDSPNSGWPEAAGAALLNVRLGGQDRRGGCTVAQPRINLEGRTPEAADLKGGMQLFWRASLLALVFNLGFSWLWFTFLIYLFPEVF